MIGVDGSIARSICPLCPQPRHTSKGKHWVMNIRPEKTGKPSNFTSGSPTTRRATRRRVSQKPRHRVQTFNAGVARSSRFFDPSKDPPPRRGGDSAPLRYVKGSDAASLTSQLSWFFMNGARFTRRYVLRCRTHIIVIRAVLSTASIPQT